MFKILFYKDKNGYSDIQEYLDILQERGKTSKTARINHEKILAYITLLKRSGTQIGKPVVRYIGGDIWELRPLDNRILFFFWNGNGFVLLSHFMKRTDKTPDKEKTKATRRMVDYLERKQNENES